MNNVHESMQAQPFLHRFNWNTIRYRCNILECDIGY